MKSIQPACIEKSRSARNSFDFVNHVYRKRCIGTRVARRLFSSNSSVMGSSEIFDQIRQIAGQYEAEVKRGNKAWPKAIKDRVAVLLESGTPSTRISKATGIPYFTVLKWRKTKHRPRGRNGGFKEIAVATDIAQKVDVVVAHQNIDTQKVVAATTTQKLAIAFGGQVQRPDVLVPITTPDGFKIELPCMDAAIDFIMKLRRIGD